MIDVSFEIFYEEKEAFKKAETFVTGFHGLGAVGYIAVKHIIDILKLKRVGVLKSSAAPPFISLNDDGILTLSFEFYTDPENRIIFFFPRLPPYRHAESEFSEKLANWVIKNFKSAILIGGVDKRLAEEEKPEETVRYIPTRAYLENEEEDSVIRKNFLTPGLFVQGPLAVMLGIFDLQQFPCVGVLAFAEHERPDPEGAANAVKILNQFLDISCSIEELMKNAAIFEEEIIKNSQIFPQKDGNPPETYT